MRSRSMPFWPRRICATRFRSDEGGVALLEFAIGFPILIILFLASYEVWNISLASRQLQSVANSIGQMLAQSVTGVLTYGDLSTATSVTPVLFPALLTDPATGDWSTKIKTTISSVVITPTPSNCTTKCTYDTAKVAWSRGPSAARRRACGSNLTAAPNTDSPSLTTLPTDAFTAGSVIVVDVEYTYTPRIWVKVIEPFTMKRTAYFQPRYILPTVPPAAQSYIKYDNSDDDGLTTKCTGYT